MQMMGRNRHVQFARSSEESGQVQGDPDGLRNHNVADDKTSLRFIKRSLRERCVQTGLGLV
jgi:hypothetical protein